MHTGKGGIAETTREALLAALDRFDQEQRGSDQWQDWENRRNHKYAIAHGGRLYPVKAIISQASGTPRATFEGGQQANTYMRRYGFTIVTLRS